MKEIKYSNFTVVTRLNEPVTVENFFKFPIDIYVGTEVELTLQPEEVFKQEVENILSGDESLAKEALANYICRLRKRLDATQNYILS